VRQRATLHVASRKVDKLKVVWYDESVYVNVLLGTFKFSVKGTQTEFMIGTLLLMEVKAGF
jgi:hypothetical protein